MDIADGPCEGDVSLEKEGIKVFLEKEADRMLSEATIDYTAEQGIIISGMSHSSC
jgi:Fe-S cluster assembly iron-binding protein IscA